MSTKLSLNLRTTKDGLPLLSTLKPGDWFVDAAGDLAVVSSSQPALRGMGVNRNGTNVVYFTTSGVLVVPDAQDRRVTPVSSVEITPVLEKGASVPAPKVPNDTWQPPSDDLVRVHVKVPGFSAYSNKTVSERQAALPYLNRSQLQRLKERVNAAFLALGRKERER